MRILIVGAGIAGLSTAWAAARRGHRVTLLERDVVPNPLGASGDQHRIIRRAYGDMHGYTRRMSEAFVAWDELWRDLGREHVARVGFMGISFAPGDRADLYREGLARGGYPFESLDRDRAVARFPFLNRDCITSVFVSPEGGALLCQRIAADMLGWLRERNVDIREHAAVRSVEPDAAAVTLASGERIAGDAVVVTAGAWVTTLIPDLTPTLASQRTCVVYLDPPADLRAAWEQAPSIPGIGEPVDGYVLPPVDGTDLKFGASFTRTDWTPDEPFEVPEAQVLALRDRFGPAFARIGEYRVKGSRRCVYTFTADHHFFTARRGAAWIISACSGHGYKFGTAVGRRVVDAMESGDERALAEWIEARECEPGARASSPALP